MGNDSESKEDDKKKPIPFDDALRRMVKSPPKHKTSDGGSSGKPKPRKAKPRKTR